MDLICHHGPPFDPPIIVRTALEADGKSCHGCVPLLSLRYAAMGSLSERWWRIIIYFRDSDSLLGSFQLGALSFFVPDTLHPVKAREDLVSR
jgi:hypothetical protein